MSFPAPRRESLFEDDIDAEINKVLKSIPAQFNLDLERTPKARPFGILKPYKKPAASALPQAAVSGAFPPPALPLMNLDYALERKSMSTLKQKLQEVRSKKDAKVLGESASEKRDLDFALRDQLQNILVRLQAALTVHRLLDSCRGRDLGQAQAKRADREEYRGGKLPPAKAGSNRVVDSTGIKASGLKVSFAIV